MAARLVIYIPGLGDSRLAGQKLLVSTWRLWGVTPVVFPMNWADGENFAAKFERLLQLVDTQFEDGHRISLVGASAGAGAVINAFAARKNKIDGVVVIAGKVNNPEGIGTNYRSKNPAFVESAYMVQQSLDQLDFDIDRPRIQSRQGFIDPLIPRSDSTVVGGRNKVVPGIGHSIIIATQLIFGAPFFLRWLKKRSK
jgi:pimeloyl-ACP methyl ester carboxylesterase